MMIFVCSPLVCMDPNSRNKASMFVYLLDDALNEYSYDATLAGLRFNLGITTTGLQVQFCFISCSFSFPYV